MKLGSIPSGGLFFHHRFNGRISKWPKGAGLDPVDVCLRKFESCSYRNLYFFIIYHFDYYLILSIIIFGLFIYLHN